MNTYVASEFLSDVFTVDFVGNSLVVKRTTKDNKKIVTNDRLNVKKQKGSEENLQLLLVIELNDLLLAGSRVGNI